jgi:predicted ATP-grasp superfamily ATP-dependent carboligase
LGRRAVFEVGVAGYRPGRLAVGRAAISRYTTHYDLLPDPSGRADEFGEALGRLVAKRGYDLVIATLDPTLARLATVSIAVPTFPDVGPAFHALTDKVALADLSATAHVAYPRTLAPRNDDEARRAADELGLPAVVKSSRSAEARPLLVRSVSGARVCRDLEDVVVAVRELRAGGLRPIVQSRVRSVEKINAVVMRRNGASEYRYAHRVLRETPISGGVGVALETISVDEGPGGEAADLLERVCDAAAYAGLVQAEFYRSADDGRLYLLDVNPRLWGSAWFAERLGQRVVERGVRFALDLPPLGPRPYRVGKRFHWPAGEWLWLRERDKKIAGLIEIARSTRPWDIFEFVDGRDPAPLVHYAVSALRTQLRRSNPGNTL